MFNVNKKSHVIRYVLILRIFSASKKLRFWQNHKKVLNQLNFASNAKLHKDYVQGSRIEVMCGSHVEGVASRSMQLAQSDLHLQMDGV